MNAFPPIPPLDSKAVKALVRAIRVLRYDHPAFGLDELAEAFEDQERWHAKDGRETLFTAWLTGPRWRAAFDRAAELAGRVDARRQQEKLQRQRWKDVIRDKQPATEAQLRYVSRLARAHGETGTPVGLSKLAASRLIQRYKDEANTQPSDEA